MSIEQLQSLATYRKLIDRAQTRWAAFGAKRAERLTQWHRHGRAAEKVAENIVEDLLTEVLDWALGDLNNQLDYADIVVTQIGIKRLLIETKRPGALTWNRAAVNDALDQARRYAGEQRVNTIAISDGLMLYAADLTDGGLRDRLYVSLENAAFPPHLWWLSRDGIYRQPVEVRVVMPEFEDDPCRTDPATGDICDGALLHPKYQLPVSCFAYAGDASRPGTWKLPHLHADGSVDERRLPGAIRCLLTNYRGARVRGIPETAVPDTLVRLAKAAARLGKMPEQNPTTADSFRQLADVLRQLDRSYSDT